MSSTTSFVSSLVRNRRNRIILLAGLITFLGLILLSRRSLRSPALTIPRRDRASSSSEDDPEFEALSQEARLDGSNEYQDDDEPKDHSHMSSRSGGDELSKGGDDDDDDELPAGCDTPLHFLEEGKRRRNPVALASFPGSGNTWLRFLIEQGSRVYTGSAYQDQALNETYAGEGMISSAVIAVKTHYPCPNCWTYQKCSWCAGTLPVTASMTGMVKDADAAVFMLRSPFDALLAEFHRLRTGQHAGKMKPEAFFKVPAKKPYETEYDKPTWPQFVNQRLVAYAMAARTYLDKVTTAKTPREVKKAETESASDLSKEEFIAADRFLSKGGKLTKLVFYERLKAHPDEELTKVFQFFQDIYEVENLKDSILTPAETAAECAVKHNTRATKNNFKWLRNNTEIFNPWKKGQVKQVCDALGKWWFKEVWGECMDGLLQTQRSAVSP